MVKGEMEVPASIIIRPAVEADLPAINGIIEAAVMSWDLPERVKRLSLASYRYKPIDLDYLETVVAVDGSGEHILGVAAWEQAGAKDAPPGPKALLLHGLYVHPSFQHRGVGSALYVEALKAVAESGCDGLLVKAQDDAVGFFSALGMQRLLPREAGRDYANRFWMAVQQD